VGSRRMTAFLAVGLTIGLLFPAAASAATWDAPATVWSRGATTDSADATGLVTLTGNTVAVGYSTRQSSGARNIFVRRSADSGATWQSPVQVSASGKSSFLGLGGISGYESSIDVAWWEPDAGGLAHVAYARSNDGGATFKSPVRLTKPGQIFVPVVGHGPGGVVAVVWHNRTLAKIFVRVSHDGGQTFAPRQELWRTSESFGYWHHFAIAIADGVVYVASSNPEGIQVRRSFDGLHWGRRTQIAWYNPDLEASGITWPVSLAAEGDQAYVGFTKYTKNGFVPSYRRTTDKGATWSARYGLGASFPEFKSTLTPLLAVNDGIVRTVFGWNGVRYRESSDGVTWSAAEVVSADAFYPIPTGVGFTDRPVVAYSRPEYVTVRAAQP